MAEAEERQTKGDKVTGLPGYVHYSGSLVCC